MSCSVRSKRSVRRGPASTAAIGDLAHLLDDGDKPRQYEIAGTWDFKWPLDAEVRVAFQKPPPEMRVSDHEFRAAVGQVVKCARRWQLPPTIELEFLDDPADFLAPPLGEAHSFTDQHRSPFHLDPRPLPYDVLVSMADLPILRVDPFRAFGQELERVLFPVAELGSYARRADYGAPTMYIGRFGHALALKFCEYFESRLGQHVCVHEFGHALGIPHMHQHPDLILPSIDGLQQRSEDLSYRELDQARAAFYKSIPEVQAVIRDALGIDVTPDIVKEHLLEVWRGNKSFSDWVELDTEARIRHGASATLDSVMTMPLYRCCSRVGGQTDCSRLLDENIILEPSALDTSMLQHMYQPAEAKETRRPLAPKAPELGKRQRTR